MAALFDGCLQTLIGLYAETFRVDNCLTMLLQFVQIAKIANPPVADELFQRSCGKSFNIHTGLFTEMGEFLDEFGCTMIVLTV